MCRKRLEILIESLNINLLFVQVLPHLHRLMGSKRLPMSGLSLVHFDAHSDLSVPREFKAESVYDVPIVYK